MREAFVISAEDGTVGFYIGNPCESSIVVINPSSLIPNLEGLSFYVPFDRSPKDRVTNAIGVLNPRMLNSTQEVMKWQNFLTADDMWRFLQAGLGPELNLSCYFIREKIFSTVKRYLGQSISVDKYPDNWKRFFKGFHG